MLGPVIRKLPFRDYHHQSLIPIIIPRCFSLSAIHHQHPLALESNGYCWTYRKTATENNALYSIVMADGNALVKSNDNDDLYSSLLNSVSTSGITNEKDLRQLQMKIMDAVKWKTLNITAIKSIMQDYASRLKELKEPLQSHFTFIKKLDRSLVNRYKSEEPDVWKVKSNVEEAIELSLVIYECSPPTAMIFSNLIVNNVLGGPDFSLDLDQFLKVMFLLVVSRRRIDQQQVNWCQKFIHKNLDSLTIAQLSLVFVAFHKSMTYITDSKLYKNILNKIIAEIHTERDATLRSSLLKGIIYSLILPGNQLSTALIDSFLKLDNLSLYNLIHLCEFSVNKKCYHPVLIDKALDVLENEIEHLREKDIERILKIVCCFDHVQPPCPSISRAMVKLDNRLELCDDEALVKTVHCILRSCFILGLYPPLMIDYVLEQNWLKKLNFEGDDIHLNYWILMTIRDCLMIERHPEYDGRLENLNAVFQAGICHRQLRIPIPTVLAAHKEDKAYSMNIRNLNMIRRAARTTFTDREVMLGHVLSTSATPDIFITSTPKHVRLLRSSVRTPECFAKSYVIVYLAKQVYADSNYSHISGHYRLRQRLFEKLGLTVINIPFYEFYHKSDDDEDDDLKEYLQKRIKEHEP